ncbi:hypothetical protein FPV67DRAFT_1504421, partial [Lyophyllum atratum]
MQNDQLWGEWRSWSYSKKYMTGAQKRADSCPTGPPQRRSLISSVLERREQRNGNITGLANRELTPRALDTVDLRFTYGTTVKNQGGSSACVSFTTTTLVEATVKRTYMRVGITKDLSPLWVHACRSEMSTDLGTDFQYVYGKIGNSYFATEGCMPCMGLSRCPYVPGKSMRCQPIRQTSLHNQYQVVRIDKRLCCIWGCHRH